MEFNDRRTATMVSPANPADAVRKGLKNPAKPGQYTRARIQRLDRVHTDVVAGRATPTNAHPMARPFQGLPSSPTLNTDQFVRQPRLATGRGGRAPQIRGLPPSVPTMTWKSPTERRRATGRRPISTRMGR